MSTHPNAPAEGDVLAGKYRVERVLGVGGMGVVVAAMHLVLGQRVAIKFLLQHATPEVVERFLREARAAVRLKSEHVARVTDVGELPNGAPYMVMEYLEGGDLAQVVRSRGPLPIHEAVEYVLQACEGISEAHSLGIIHRDLKPANLFLTTASDGSNTVKVLDFGISKSMEDASEGDDMQLTKTTAVLGSPLYMSPEQLRSARGVTAQSDIWSVGAILHQLVTGKVPFNTTTFSDLVLMVNTQSPPPMATLRADVPPQLEAAILRCLERKREARFPNVGELAWAIAELGPPDARARAERISRTLETAGLTVTRPAGYSLYSTGGPMATSQQGPMATSQQGPMATSQAALTSSTAGTTQSGIGGTQATMVTARPARLGPVVLAAIVALGALVGGVAALVVRGRKVPPSAAVTTNQAPQPTTTALAPVVIPASGAASNDAPGPTTTATPAPTASGAPTATAGPKPGGSATQTKTAPAASTTKKNNPLNIGLED